MSVFLFNKFLLHNCKLCDADVKVKFSPSSQVCFSLSASLTGSHPDGHKPRGEAAPAENYESTIPLLLKGKDPRPLSQLRTGVRALITGSLTFHICFPRTVNKDGRQKQGQSVSITDGSEGITPSTFSPEVMSCEGFKGVDRILLSTICYI